MWKKTKTNKTGRREYVFREHIYQSPYRNSNKKSAEKKLIKRDCLNRWRQSFFLFCLINPTENPNTFLVLYCPVAWFIWSLWNLRQEQNLKMLKRYGRYITLSYSIVYNFFFLGLFLEKRPSHSWVAEASWCNPCVSFSRHFLLPKERILAQNTINSLLSLTPSTIVVNFTLEVLQLNWVRLWT